MQVVKGIKKQFFLPVECARPRALNYVEGVFFNGPEERVFHAK